MKALEFEAKLQPDRSLPVPQDLADSIPADQTLRVIILVPESEEDQNWKQLTYDEFLSGYSESDSVYDSL